MRLNLSGCSMYSGDELRTLHQLEPYLRRLSDKQASKLGNFVTDVDYGGWTYNKGFDLSNDQYKLFVLMSGPSERVSRVLILTGGVSPRPKIEPYSSPDTRTNLERTLSLFVDRCELALGIKPTL